MTSRRMSPARIAGIAVWTAASVTWSTAAVAWSNMPDEVEGSTMPEDGALPPPIEQEVAVLESIPTVPESGLVVLRYTAVEEPKAQAVVRRVVTAGAAVGSPRSAAAPTTTTSSGS